MNKLFISNFNFHSTLLGGQAFNWDLIDGVFWGFTQDKIIKIIPNKDFIYWQTYPNKDDFEFINRYLRLNDNYQSILKTINKDNHINAAIKSNPNLRILRQDLHQTILSFILSSNKNIKAIRQSVRLLSQKYGSKLNIENRDFYLFPKTEVFADLTIQELMESRIGYRAKFISETSKMLLDKDFNKELLSSTNSSQTRLLLKTLNGVGNKVADCIMVFALGYNDITPLDVWALKALVDLYNHDSKSNYFKLSSWLNNYFEGHAAYAGQFLFEYIRGFKTWTGHDLNHMV